MLVQILRLTCSREKTQAIVNNYKAVFKGFYSFQDAKQYLEANGIQDYDVDRVPYEDELNNQNVGSRLYAVSQGRSLGIFSCYSYEVNTNSSCCC